MADQLLTSFDSGDLSFTANFVLPVYDPLTDGPLKITTGAFSDYVLASLDEANAAITPEADVLATDYFMAYDSGDSPITFTAATLATYVEEAIDTANHALSTLDSPAGTEYVVGVSADGTTKTKVPLSNIADLASPNSGIRVYDLDGTETVAIVKDLGLGDGPQIVNAPLTLITPYADHREPRPFVGGIRWPNRKTITLFGESEGSWTSVGAGSRIFNTTGLYGAVSQQLVTDGAGGTSIARLNTLNNAPYNATGKSVAITLKISDVSLISGIRLDLGSNNLTDRYTWNNILGSQSVRPIQDGRYVEYTFPLGSNDVTAGSPALDNIDAFQLRFTDTGVAPCTIDLERVFLFDTVAGASCITMDDGYRSWYTLGKPIMDEFDILTTMYCIERYHNPLHPHYDDVGGTRLTEAMIREMVEQGHELAYHEVGNSLRGLDPEGDPWTPLSIEASILSFKKWAWDQFGVEVTTGAYPGGEIGSITADIGIDDKTVRDIFAEHLPIGRTINLVAPDTLPPGDRSLTRCFGYVFGNGVNKMTLTKAQGIITQAETYGGIVSWSWHELVADEVLPEDPNTTFWIDEFGPILDEIRNSTLRIATMQEIYATNTSQ